MDGSKILMEDSTHTKDAEGSAGSAGSAVPGYRGTPGPDPGTPAPLTGRPMTAPATPLVVKSLVRRYGDFTAVDRLDLEVRPGEILGFLGPNGAGKTTTLRACSGLLRPDEGEVTIAGISSRDPPSRPRHAWGSCPTDRSSTTA